FPFPLRPPPRASLFPSTTLFRSGLALAILLERLLDVPAQASEGVVDAGEPVEHRVAGDEPVPPAHSEPVEGAAGMELNERGALLDRKSTRLNSSHVKISYAVFCL